MERTAQVPDRARNARSPQPARRRRAQLRALIRRADGGDRDAQARLQALTEQMLRDMIG